MTGVLGRESSARWTRWYLWIRGGGRSAMQTGIVPADRQTSSRSRDGFPRLSLALGQQLRLSLHAAPERQQMKTAMQGVD